jgi:hypothetical protein
MRVIALTGKKRVGKDTAAKYLYMHYNFTHLAFADPIVNLLKELMIEANIPRKDILHFCNDRKEEQIPVLNKSYRQLTREIGEGFKKILDSSFES